MADRIKLGQMVRDDISGLNGKVIAITNWLYGCQRITFQPIGSKDGKPYETVSIDEPQAMVEEEPAAPPAEPRHGDREDVGARRPDASRQ